MSRPPRFELYDLQNDPYEFHNLAEDPDHKATLKDLQQHLTAWRRQTSDPLLNEMKLRRLTTEIRSVKSKKASKTRPWRYPNYLLAQ